MVRLIISCTIARWIEEEGMWALTLRNVESDDPENAVYTVKHHVVIMCGGPLSQPRMPEGIDTSVFKGTQFHSQSWRHDVTLGMRTSLLNLLIR